MPYLIIVSMKGQRPPLHLGHCRSLVKYFFTVLGYSQEGLSCISLCRTCCRFLRYTADAFPCRVKNEE